MEKGIGNNFLVGVGFPSGVMKMFQLDKGMVAHHEYTKCHLNCSLYHGSILSQFHRNFLKNQQYSKAKIKISSNSCSLLIIFLPSQSFRQLCSTCSFLVSLRKPNMTQLFHQFKSPNHVKPSKKTTCPW